MLARVSHASCLSSCAQSAPITLDGLQISMSRESSKEPPQSFIKTFKATGMDAAAAAAGGSLKLESTERQVTNYPHPYPQARV